MIQLVKLPVQKGNVPLRIAKGHFVTNHSHINYYIDITFQKTRISEDLEIVSSASPLSHQCSARQPGWGLDNFY